MSLAQAAGLVDGSILAWERGRKTPAMESLAEQICYPTRKRNIIVNAKHLRGQLLIF